METTKNMMLRIGRVLFSTLLAAASVTMTSCEDGPDEISAYVKASKEMFDNNPELMKQAAEAAGIDSYTIKWNNLQGPEDSNFVYEVK